MTAAKRLRPLLLPIALAFSGCASNGQCWVTADVAADAPSLASAPYAEDGPTLYRVVGAYREGWDFALLSMGWDRPIAEVPLLTTLDYCVATTDQCSRAWEKATDLPGDYVGYYSSLAMVEVLARFVGSARGFDCPLGTIVVEQMIRVERPSDEDLEVLRRRVESDQ